VIAICKLIERAAELAGRSVISGSSEDREVWIKLIFLVANHLHLLFDAEFLFHVIRPHGQSLSPAFLQIELLGNGHELFHGLDGYILPLIVIIAQKILKHALLGLLGADRRQEIGTALKSLRLGLFFIQRSQRADLHLLLIDFELPLG